MFGMSFAEIIVIAVVAVIFLGPDKLPDAMIKFARFFKLIKQTANSAKSTFENEIKIAELKEDAKRFKDNISETTNSVRKKLTFDELDALKKTASDTTKSINEKLSEVKKELSNPLNALNDSEVEVTEPNSGVDNVNSQKATMNENVNSQANSSVNSQKGDENV